MTLKQGDIILGFKKRQRVNRAFKIKKSPSLGFLFPLVGVAVAVEDNALMFGDSFLNYFIKLVIKILRLFKPVGKLRESIGNHSVKHNISVGNRGSRAQHSELELIARKGKGRGAVTVGIIAPEKRDNIRADCHFYLLRVIVAGAAFNRQKQVGKLVA